MRRANYQSLIWYEATNPKPFLPPPEEHGWELVDGKLDFKWTEGLLMPQEPVDVLLEGPEHTLVDDSEPEVNSLVDVIFDNE